MKLKFRKRFITLAAIGAISVLGARYAVAQTGKGAVKPAGQTIALRSLDGQAIDINSLRGKVTVLAIGASWLPLTRDQVKIVNNLQQAYGKRGVSVYFVSTDAESDKAKNFATDAQLRAFGDKYKLVVPSLRDSASTTLKAFGLDQIPSFVVLDKQGNVAAKINGLDVENDVTAQLSGEIDKIL